MEVTDKEIEKAFDDLAQQAEIIKADDDQLNDEEIFDEDFEKGNEEFDDEEFEKAESEDVDEELDDEDEDPDEDDEEVEKAKKKKKQPMKKSDEIKKGVEVSGFLKELVEDIEKANGKTQEVLGQVALVVGRLNKRVGELEEDLEKAITSPRKAKSNIRKEQVTSKFEKSAENEFGASTEDGKKVFGLRTHAREITNILDQKTFAKDGEMNVEFSKALTSFEATRVLPADIINKLNVEDNIVIDVTR